MVQAPAKADFTAESTDAEHSAKVVVLHLPPGCLTDDLLLQISELNDDLRFERNAEGALEISPPAGYESSDQSGRVYAQILTWSDEVGGGRVFESSAGMSLSDGSVLAPDASWLSEERFEQGSAETVGFLRVCPDLVIEVRSHGQSRRKQREKMEQWMAAGARLGWLLDAFTDDGEVWVYRAGVPEPERLERPDSLSGEDVADGLAVDLSRIWR
jgi:Uma2 family endonuclease